MRSFKDKRCRITGAGSGIGKAAAGAVAREGGQLVPPGPGASERA